MLTDFILKTAATTGADPAEPTSSATRSIADILKDSSLNVLQYFTTSRFFISVIAVIVVVVLIVVFRKVFAYYLKKQQELNGPDNAISNERLTLIHVTRNVIIGIVVLLLIIFLLQLNGFQVSSLITSASILSAILGLALQDTIKDIIQIITGKFFRVGDVIKYQEYEGVVLSFSMRSTKIQDIRTMNVITIGNRLLSQIEVQEERRLLTVSISYEEPVDKMYEIFEDIIPRLTEIEGITAAKFLGLRTMDDSAMIYLYLINCDPKKGYPMMRAANRFVKSELEKLGIAIPFNQLDVHVGSFDPYLSKEYKGTAKAQPDASRKGGLKVDLEADFDEEIKKEEAKKTTW